MQDLNENFEREEDLEKNDVTDEEFEEMVLEILADLDGEDIKCIDNLVNPDICERVIMASFVSDRQIISALGKIIRCAKDSGKKAKCPTRKKNIDTEWSVIDCGKLMIHLFRREVREYYNLDRFLNQGY